MAESQFDIFRMTTDEVPVNFEAGVLTEIQGRTNSFATCRVVEGGKAGYCTSNTLDDDGLVARATETAPYGKEVDVDLPGPAEVAAVDVFSQATADLATAELADWGRRIIDGVRKGIGKDLPVGVRLDKSVQRFSIRNSRGISYEQAATGLTVMAELSDAREGDIHEVFDVEYSPEPGGVQPERMVRYVVDYYELGRETTGVATAAMPVLVHPFAVPQFLLPLLAGLDGESIKDGTSPLKDRMGERIFEESVTVFDDPFWAGSPGSAPFDAEGVAARRRPLVERGVLTSFNHTLETAKAVGHEPTGGAGRGADGKPKPGVFNLVMEAGDTPHEEILSSIDRGLFLRYMSGSGHANNLAGEFSMGVYSGFLIEGGRLTKRVKNVMVAGNVYDAFKRVAAVSADRVNSWTDDNRFALTPYVLLDGVSVAGA
jgi:PmbA protein